MVKTIKLQQLAVTELLLVLWFRFNNLNMKRETFQAQNIFNKSIVNSQPNLVLNQPEVTFHFRTQIPPFTSNQQSRPDNIPSLPQPYQRYSHDITTNNQAQNSNAFVHLRNQISNLRSQFSKLIQKDHSKMTEKANYESRDKQRKDPSVNRKINRMPTYSTVGFSNKVSQFEKSEKKSESKQNYDQIFRFKTKDSETREQTSTLGDKNATKDLKKQFSITEDNKLLAKSYLDKTGSNKLDFEATKRENLQLEVVKLRELRLKSQQKQLSFKRELKDKEDEFHLKLIQKNNQIQDLKLMLDQGNISLSLKNSLVQKLQAEISKLTKQNKCLLNESRVTFQQMSKIKQKHDYELKSAQQSHRLNIELATTRYQQASEQLKRKNQENLQLIAKLAERDNKYEDKLQQKKFLEDRVSFIENQLQRIKEEHKQKCQSQITLKEKVAQLQGKISNPQTKVPQVPQQMVNKLKLCEQQNVDLKKRVDSYKKSVQQLNSSNNASREKYAQAKQQLKVVREDMKIKDVLINSLYRDISILDNQLRQIPALKAIIAGNSKFIEQLNQLIIHLQFQKLSQKYKKSEQI